MIDLKRLRSSPDEVRAALARRGDASVMALLDELRGLDERRRTLNGQLDLLKTDRNKFALEDAALVKQHGKLPKDVIEQRKDLGLKITGLEHELRSIETVLSAKGLFVPNLPLAAVPDGDAAANRVVRAWGTPRSESGLKPHWELGERLGLLDLPRGAKISGSGFPLLTGMGARLSRGLIAFMLDLHTREHGYREVAPPFVVKRESMQGTSQLPKFEEDAYKTAPDDLFLIPTAEVPVTNIHRDEILDGATLPIAYTAYTPCFRREAGAAGKDTRGLLRVHQFDKVELVRLVAPETSSSELEVITRHAATVLERLELPYRVVLLAAGDTGFGSAMTYDLEVFAPGVGTWLEVSSASVFTDFQARRANIRFRPRAGEKPDFVHTLNASGVALPRTIAAILEHGQEADGSVRLPAALVPYVGVERLGPAGG
ncbi:MAG TPA: serine--tRNA ligase [Gemmatimonadales bacterium]|nr:serine--tRNA ligase [Gemmatimonadales bacterium]